MSRPPISLQVTPSGPAPRRIRSALYWFGERLADFRTAASPRDSASAVRSRLRKASSSRELHGLTCLISFFSVPTKEIILVRTDVVNTTFYGAVVTRPAPADPMRFSQAKWISRA